MIINAIKTCITVLITLSEETEHSRKVINVCVNIDLSVTVTWDFFTVKWRLSDKKGQSAPYFHYRTTKTSPCAQTPDTWNKDKCSNTAHSALLQQQLVMKTWWNFTSTTNMSMQAAQLSEAVFISWLHFSLQIQKGNIWKNRVNFKCVTSISVCQASPSLILLRIEAHSMG